MTQWETIAPAVLIKTKILRTYYGVIFDGPSRQSIPVVIEPTAPQHPINSEPRREMPKEISQTAEIENNIY